MKTGGSPFIPISTDFRMKAATWMIVAMLPVRSWGIGAEETTRPTPPPEGWQREKAVEKAAPDEAGTVTDKHQVLVESLSGLAIAPDAASALRLQGRTRQGVAVEGFSGDEEQAIRKLAGEFIGKPVTLAELDRLQEILEGESRRAGFLLRRVSYPAQEITSGVVAVRMGQARAGTVNLSGKPVFGRKFIADGFRTRPGMPVDEAVVLDDLDWLNRNPLRRASIAHAPAADDDTLDLTLRVRSAKPWRVYGGIDNQLSETLGDERLYLGFQHGDVFGLDQRFTGQVTTALQRDALLGGSLSHEIPLPGRQTVALSGGYTTSETDVAGPLDQSGEFTRVGLEHRVRLPRWMGIGHEWKSGMEFRNNDYLFPDESTETVRFFQLETGWEGRRADAFGLTRMDCSLLYSPGQGVLGSDDEDFIALGADGAESLILRMNIERLVRLGKAGSLIGRLRGQWADSELLSSDQISAGGMNRVRGFDEVVGYASSGLVGGIEWQSPQWRHPLAGDWTGVCFVDGAVLNRDSPADPGELLSAGFGFRFRWSERVAGRLDCGFPLECPDTIDSDPMLHFALGFSW